MPGSPLPSGYCAGSQCVSFKEYRSDYCGSCNLLRSQHRVSHEIEGHTRIKVQMCPSCDNKPEGAFTK